MRVVMARQPGAPSWGRRVSALVVPGLLASLLLTGISTSAAPETLPLKVALELDGQFAGWLSSAEGGQPTGLVVVETPDPAGIARKHIAGVKYEDISLTFGTGMSKDFYQWIADSVAGKGTRKGGAIIVADYNHNELSRLSFTHGQLAEVGLPGLDAASKDAAKMTVKLSPETTRMDFPSNLKYSQPDPKVQKKWLPANFRVSIDGLADGDGAKKINSIDPIVISHLAAGPGGGGGGGGGGKAVGPPVLSNVILGSYEYRSKPFFTALEDFVVKGNNGQAQERSGKLEYLASDDKTVLFTLTFSHLGIFKLTPEKVESNQASLRRVKAEFYCEQMSFAYSGAAWS